MTSYCLELNKGKKNVLHVIAYERIPNVVENEDVKLKYSEEKLE